MKMVSAAARPRALTFGSKESMPRESGLAGRIPLLPEREP
jgi:hypothetical protein